MLLVTACFLAAVSLSQASKPSDFDWDDIKPSWDLEYTPCYDGLQCARLILPLDWLNPENQKNQTITIAIAKVPAKVSATSPVYGGTLITNPGGPGDSGIVHMLKNGRFIQGMVDGQRHYEVLSFDPRGMFFSTPAADCYGGKAEGEFARWQLQGFGLLADSSTTQVKRRMAHATAFGKTCERADAGQSNIREFMSTASVARDMLALVEKIEVSRQKEAAEAQTQHDDDGGHEPSRIELRSTSKDVSEARIQYFGTSYGTYLGNTFLSMFPGRVHRMILDGLVVGEEYANLEWSTNLADTTQVVNYFYQTCFQAKSKCALWKPSDPSWETIKARVDKLVKHLDDNPQPISGADSPETIITGAEVRTVTLDPLYNPLDFFEDLATLLNEAIQGNYTMLLEWTGLSGKVDVCETGKGLEYSWQGHASNAVACGDAIDVRGHNASYWESYVQRLKKLSPDIGDLWAEGIFSCSGWQIRPKHVFKGPFTSPKADPSIKPGRPSAPLLLLSSLFDPVTPLQSASKVARGHPGSRVLLQKSVGHCAFLSSPSECTNRHIRRYLETGEMPDEGAECEPDCVPWEDCPVERAHLPR